MKPKGKFEIVEFKNATGSTSFRVTGTKVDGTRVRKNFAHRAEAEGELSTLTTEALNTGVQVKATRLSDDQLTQAENAFRALGDTSLDFAIRFFKDNYQDAFKPIVLRDAFENFIADKTRENARPDTITNLRRKNSFLLAKYGDSNVHEVLPEQAKALIYRAGTSPVYQDNVRRAMGGFFNWCVEHEHSKQSPLSKVKAIKTERDEPEVLSLADVRALLKNAARYKGGVTLPFVALSIFAGIRPQREMRRITWDDIDLGQKQITITGKAAKMRERRIVEMSPNLIAWLKPFALSKQAFIAKNWRRDFDKVKRLSGIASWTIDIMRHTAISYHLAEHQHEGKTAQWAGNSPDVIQKHYRGLVNAKESKLFWSIRPDATGKKRIVRLKAA